MNVNGALASIFFIYVNGSKGTSVLGFLANMMNVGTDARAWSAI
jgi:hypothetical protein